MTPTLSRLGLLLGAALALSACAGTPAPTQPPPHPAHRPAPPGGPSAAQIPPHALPDPGLTPGAASAAGSDQICRPGYARSVRNVPWSVRRQVFRSYGLAGNHTGWCRGPGGCELDHLISLELGGSNAPDNLWPEPYDGPWNAHIKDRLENRLHRLVCTGHLALSEAQRAIATDWIAAYRRIFGDARQPEG